MVSFEEGILMSAKLYLGILFCAVVCSTIIGFILGYMSCYINNVR
jgi:ABC-type dipeptide/oligopeptide/nickel transport system permease subunit